MDKYSYISSNISILDVASRLGYTPVRKGKYYSLKEHDSVIIDIKKNCYWQNSIAGSGTSIGQGGSVIDFAINLGRMDLKEALTYLTNELNSDFNIKENKPNIINNPSKNSKNTFILPDRANNERYVIAYLNKTRKIDVKIIKELIKTGNIYQDKHNNCVFVGFNSDNQPIFATKRGTNTYKPFYGDVAGSDYNTCWHINNNSSSLIVTEAVIDALSLMTLNGKANKQYDYLALGGVGKWKAIETHLTQKTYKMVIIATDNDNSGQEAASIIQNYIETNYSNIQTMKAFPPAGKDWNDFLKSKR